MLDDLDLGEFQKQMEAKENGDDEDGINEEVFKLIKNVDKQREQENKERDEQIKLIGKKKKKKTVKINQQDAELQLKQQ